jgi:hypothetical protein
MTTATGMVLFRLMEGLSPSWYMLLLPQQYAVPVVVSAQLCEVPVEIVVKVTPTGIVTATGILLSVVVPLPS